jgi:hypothetical protein
MKRILFSTLVGLLLLVSSCSTPQAPQAYHAIDNTALVIQSLDNSVSRIIEPTPSGNVANTQILSTAKSMPQHQTAVIILENYQEPQLGDQFRNRATPWFISLRGLGYDHIVFLQGKGNNNPEGLIELAKYD